MEAIEYVMNGPYFWSLMGWTTATAVFIGAMLYNGDFERLRRGVITISAYAGLLWLINWARVTDSITHKGILTNAGMAYAGLTTIVFVTLAYMLGLVIGYLTVRRSRRQRS